MALSVVDGLNQGCPGQLKEATEAVPSRHPTGDAA